MNRYRARLEENTFVEILMRQKNHPKLNWRNISANPAITFDLLFPGSWLGPRPWDWTEVSKNGAIKVSDMLANFMGLPAGNPVSVYDPTVTKKPLPWDWEAASQNPTFTTDDFMKIMKIQSDAAADSSMPSIQLDYRALSRNNVTIEAIIEHRKHFERMTGVELDWRRTVTHGQSAMPDQWDWYELSRNPRIKVSDVLEMLAMSEYAMSKHTAIVQHVAVMPWNIRGLSANPTITSRDIAMARSIKGFAWDWLALSGNPSVKFSFIMAGICDQYGSIDSAKLRASQWNWRLLSHNTTIDIGIVLAMVEATGNVNVWDWHGLSANPSIKFADIMGTCGLAKGDRKLLWNWGGVSANPSITINDVKSTFGYKKIASAWNWSLLSAKRVTFADLEDLVKMGWVSEESKLVPYGINWYVLAQNTSITFKDIQCPYNPISAKLRSNWGALSRNPGFSASDILNQSAILKEWEWASISANPFNCHPTVRKSLEKLVADEDKRIATIGNGVGAYMPSVLVDMVLGYVLE